MTRVLIAPTKLAKMRSALLLSAVALCFIVGADAAALAESPDDSAPYDESVTSADRISVKLGQPVTLYCEIPENHVFQGWQRGDG